MAWFKKERKPRTSERIKLEIPPDAWEKCEECGHIDIKEKFLRALNVCPNCGHHRRIPAQEYIDLLVDEGSWHETETKLKSADPLKFENYAERVQAAVKKAGPLDAIRTGYARLHGMSVSLGVMDLSVTRAPECPLGSGYATPERARVKLYLASPAMSVATM